MAEAWTVVVVGRSSEKMRAASRVLEAEGFEVVGVFSEADARRAIADSEPLLAVVVGGSVSIDASERLRAAAASRGAVTIETAIGHDDPAQHFRSQIVPQLERALSGLTRG